MTTLEIWLLAISLAMDCFTVSITSGIIMRRICWRTFFIMAFFFGLFQAVMPLIGWFAASRFSHLIEEANDIPMANASMLVAIASVTTTFNLVGSKQRLSSLLKLSFIIRPPKKANNPKAIQWS